MKNEKYLKFKDKSLKISIEDYQSGNLTHEQIRKMTGEEKADWIAKLMCDNLNENVMREHEEDEARKLEEGKNKEK